MDIDLSANERVIRSGKANIQRGIEAVGGHIWLTNQRLAHRPHSLNVQKQPTDIKLSDIAVVRLCWTRLWGLIPMVPNSLAVITQNGREYRFVIGQRRDWLAAIHDARQP